jgi:hypothetical protein
VKGAGIEAVLGVEDEALVHDLALASCGRLSVKHVEEVGTVGEIVPGRHVVQAVAKPVERRDDTGELRDLVQRIPAVAVRSMVDLVLHVSGEVTHH